MANPWFRVWADMVNDPKFRTISRIAKQEISRVIAVYMHMLTCASNATERGRTEGWSDEDVATALDIDTCDVTAIREAMQGRVLDSDYLRGWEKRQPLREDGSAERSKAWREKQKKTQENADERNRTLDKNREEKIKKEPKSKASALASRLPADWSPDAEQISFCKTERPDLNPVEVAARFRDYWVAVPGAKGGKLDWPATWRNWVRNEKAVSQPRASPQSPGKFDPVAHVNRNKVNSNASDSNVIDGAIFEVVPAYPGP
jgi:hypothetical protein